MAIPEKIGRYVIKSELGRGGMATVYRAFDPSFDREVAIKVLPREMLHDPQFRSRFEREIKLVAALEHPSIVPVYDVGEEDGQPYFVMRYMPGGSLSNLIEQGKFSVQDTARIVEKIAQGLAYAHRKGIIHRDLKPDNILFDDNGDPFISDFGVAKFTEAAGSLTGSGVIGTPAYMSPEQAQGGEIDGRSDVYGLGVMVYQMLTGQQPYSADTPMGVVVKHITDPVPEILKVVPDFPPELDTIIKTSMAKDKSTRYPNAIELAKALNLIAFGEEGNLTFSTNSGIKTRIGGAAPQMPRATIGLVAIGAVLVVAVVGFFLLRNQLFASKEVPGTDTPATTLTTAPSATEEETAPAFAPFCSEENAFPLPEVRETSSSCIRRLPYSNISFPEGSQFELLNPEGSCRVEATSRGNTVIACTGPRSGTMELKVCNPPVISNADLDKCSPDATFNSENQCCVAVAPEDAGCTIFEIKLRSCQ
jgi:serine/threonine-protein kinase